VERFPEIYKELIKLQPDSYITEIAEERVELGTMGAGITPALNEYSKAVDFLMDEMKKTPAKGIAKIAQSFRFEYYELVKKYLRSNTQIIPCYAGVASAQIAPDGDVWPCCVRADSMGNLREHNYDFKAVWNSAKAAEIRRSIKNNECACPLANAGYTNLLLHVPSMFKITRRIL
jgi:MoaA/NifB/PqqE/SkfB family radical SAM enzyme